MVCGVGRIGKIPRRIAAFVIYVPPNIKSKQLEELREALATEVAAVRAAYHNPLIVVGGDSTSDRSLLRLMKSIS